MVGYNFEGEYFQNHPLSGYSGIGDAVSCTFDIGRRRKREAADRDDLMCLPVDDELADKVGECDQAAENRMLDFMPITVYTPESLASLLDPCPCSLDQAMRDHARFVPIDEPEGCFVSASPLKEPNTLVARGPVSITQMCCYVDG